VLEGSGADGQGRNDDGGFEADVAITTGELRQLLPDLLDALGGVLDPGKPTSGGAAPVPRAQVAA